MKIKLSRGEADLWIKFGTAQDDRRSTTLHFRMKWNDGTESMLSETVLCSKKDNFSRRMGRKLVVKKFLHDWGINHRFWNITSKDEWPRYKSESSVSGRWLGHVFFSEGEALTKDDRRLIWEAVCPEFKKKDERELALA